MLRLSAGSHAQLRFNLSGELPGIMADIVTNGRGGMPSWQGRLTPAEIQAVVDYTRSLP